MERIFKQAEERTKDEVNLDEWRLQYHLMPLVGWLNDPNGLCEFNGTYHIFYQYSPTSAEGKEKGWGHFTTKDFLTFKREENALFPDSDIDKDGAYSGSAYIRDNQIYFFYTGNIKFKGNFDYINEGRGHYLNGFTSKDGIHFGKKYNILKNESYPDDLSCHVRDPKIYEEDGVFYMVLGARTKNSVGCALIYESLDLKEWNYKSRIETKQPFGYMWECPDLFEIGTKKILMVCPQGLKKRGYQYENIYQSGYFFIKGNIKDNLMVYNFTELDYGFDFYAPQTFVDKSGRRIMISWMGLPDIPYKNPTVSKGWQHALTLPRVLFLKDDSLYQYPIEETKKLRKNHVHRILAIDEVISTLSKVYEAQLMPLNDNFKIRLRKDVTLNYYNHILTLSLKESGYGRNERHVEINKIEQINIFSDTSSLEIFINNGQKALTTRVYDDENDTSLQVDSQMILDLYELNKYKIV
ncbi:MULTISPECIES: glycoside hydrolase family 32 protein [Clostridium]|uniref:glycoside hydrolase family 32 protein n=1 Tax=Clostridium TaxID=1485 RepID=UPI0008242E5C|nr:MULTISPECIES: glycoside hydrolase family 32 protein [Clostridium]PJI09090.1 sucrose-6-phosphate hydrolase [Clostridium sp. CT7]